MADRVDAAGTPDLLKHFSVLIVYLLTWRLTNILHYASHITQYHFIIHCSRWSGNQDFPRKRWQIFRRLLSEFARKGWNFMRLRQV